MLHMIYLLWHGCCTSINCFTFIWCPLQKDKQKAKENVISLCVRGTMHQNTEYFKDNYEDIGGNFENVYFS